MPDALNSLYIHWPFCSSKCFYCDFVALEQHEDFQSAYHAALLKEIELFAATRAPDAQQPKTIFIGGGTPSLYPLDKMEELFTTLRKHFDFSVMQEVSIETNPADITEERLDAWLSFGITRLSMGVQVLDDSILSKLNRRQRIRDVMNAARLIPKYFDNYSMDLILGLPEVSSETWFTTVNQVIAWNPKHVSVYFLTIHEKTPLYYKIEKKELILPNEEIILDDYEKTVLLLEKNGYEQYEISNFAKTGYASSHNQAYWNRLPYKGFGIGACSFDGKKRSTNHNNIQTYCTNLLVSNESIISFEETLSLQQEKMETFMLMLRQRQGGGLHRMLYLVDERERYTFLQKLSLLEEKGLLTQNQGQIQLTRRGMVLENEIIMQLL